MLDEWVFSGSVNIIVVDISLVRVERLVNELDWDV